jgi:hypothetical protein
MREVLGKMVGAILRLPALLAAISIVAIALGVVILYLARLP